MCHSLSPQLWKTAVIRGSILREAGKLAYGSNSAAFLAAHIRPLISRFMPRLRKPFIAHMHDLHTEVQ